MRILFLPIDNRPVCYQLPKMIAEIHNGIQLVIPPKEYLGDLTKSADKEKLLNWFSENLTNDTNAVIISLDTIAYGGLIPSRRSTDSYDTIKKGLDKLKSILENSNAKVYAFSSIMRISNNNINIEEKEYWNLYGEKIFKYSFEKDKFGTSKTDVPQDVLNDYLETRDRNFKINKLYLEWQKEGLFEKLIFSKDDCTEYGLNVGEARQLEKMGGFTKTGADEIPLTLLASAVNEPLKAVIIFNEPNSRNLISNYEDISIENSVKGQLELAGCKITTTEDADIVLYVNNFEGHQGEIVMNRKTRLYSGTWEEPNKPYIIADVRNANGSDNNLIEQILKTGISDLFYGYSGWNTSANTLGSLICAMKFLYAAKKSNQYNKIAFKHLQAIRFLDDWAYQANVRQEIKQPDINTITEAMQPYENAIRKLMDIEFTAKYTFPWNRLFEVEIELT